MTTAARSQDEKLDVLFADYLARLDRGEHVELSSLCGNDLTATTELQPVVEMAALLERISHAPEMLSSRTQQSTTDALEQQLTLADTPRLPRHSLLPAANKLGESTQGMPFGHYNLLRLLGEGSMGMVYLAYDTKLKRTVALKTPRVAGDQSTTLLERFRREAEASADNRHPNICPIFEVGVIDGTHYLTMAYIEGESLAQRLNRLADQGERLPLHQATFIVRKLAGALAHAHEKHAVIHRDLKPANIMLDQSDDPIITDFGLARRLDMRETLLTQTGMLVGTLAYMSPEQLEGNADQIGRAADIYSLGVIFYQLLTGQLPYQGGFLSVVLQIRSGHPQRPSELVPELVSHPSLEAICLKMMAPRVEDRYGSLREVIQALNEASDEPVPPPIPPPHEVPDDAVEPPPLPARRRESWNLQDWLAHAALGGVALALLLAIGIFANPGTSAAKRETSALADGSVSAPQVVHKPAVDQPPAAAVVQQAAFQQPVPRGNEDPTELGPRVPKPAADASGTQAVQSADGKKPIIPRPPKIVVNARRGASEKFGIVSLEVTLSTDAGFEFRPDWHCRVTSRDRRVFYPAYSFTLESGAATDKPAVRGPLEKIKVHFLTYGEVPLKIDLSYGDHMLLTNHQVPLNVPANQRATMLEEWWAAYTAPSLLPMCDEARLAQGYLHDMLARRMHLPAAPAIPRATRDASQLQTYFEKSVGTFLGFDSVLVALGETGDLRRLPKESLTRPLPTPPRIAAVPYPPAPANTTIETIASHVPDDCVYLRCQSLDNYLWFRDFLLGWGGGLDEVVSPRRLDHHTRERLERQLALSLDAHAQEVLRGALDDLAVVFGDTAFADGAAVGVLFLASDNDAVTKLLLQQRQDALKAFRDLGGQQQLVKLDGNEVTMLSSSDQQLRSIYARSGNYHFITNSTYLAQRFFDCSRGSRSLANLAEFRYARYKVPVQEAQNVFLYMPDPFFQRIIGPQHRIEQQRRQQAKADVQHLELARLAAHSEGYAATRVSHLIDAGFLPSNFGERSDGSSAVLKRQAEDDRRGVPGTFVPICDLDCQLVTASEAHSYQEFSWRYRSEYRMMDPVAVVASHRGLPDGRQDVDLQITITPYARQTYARVENALSAPQHRRILGPAGELLSLRASMRTPGGTPFLALASIHDTPLEFRLVDGAVQADKLQSGQSFASQNWQLAFDRLDVGCLQTVANLMGESGPGISMQGLVTLESLVAAYVDATGWILSLPSRQPDLFNQMMKSSTGWQVRSPRADLRRGRFTTEETADNHQVRFELRSLQGTQIEPYIRAYTFLEARRASAQQAALLELMTQQYGVAAANSRAELERIHRAEFLCPLAGRLEFVAPQVAANAKPTVPAPLRWHSSRWSESSLYDEAAVPADYQFAFTHWLRGLDVGFSLREQTLSADVQLHIQPRGKADVGPQQAPQPALRK